MKIKYLKLKNWLLVALGGLLGVNLVGCDNGLIPAAEYGCPMSNYRVKGVVTDQNGNPIEGILVAQTGRTDADGNYSVDIQGAFPGENLNVSFADVDGDEHGSYLDTIVSIPTEGVQLDGGDDHWYYGDGEIVQDVTMQEK